MYWVHFGAGNIFRGFIAVLHQKLLDEKLTDVSLIAAEGFDTDIISKIYQPFGNKTELVILRGDGGFDHRTVDSISEALVAKKEHAEDWARLTELFESDGLQMVSFTITEKGYQPSADSLIGTLCGLMYSRYKSGAAPIALVSMDNCAHNGDRLRECLLAVAELKNDTGFSEYLSNPKKVGYPLSMIDKITPAPSEAVQKILEDKGLSNMGMVRTSKGSPMAPFVNAEKTEYLVIEDWFPNGRPPLEKSGVLFTGRETVDKVEKMKVGACLNPLHTALAIFGCMLGFKSISAEMNDPDLRKLVERLGYDEMLPTVENPGVLDPEEFLSTVLNERLPNPNLPDTPQRIACDTSQKIPVRFGGAIERHGGKSGDLTLIPLVLAAWLRYRQEVDDFGSPMEISPDPSCTDERELVYAAAGPELKNKIDAFYDEMQGVGAVRKTLRRVLG